MTNVHHVDPAPLSRTFPSRADRADAPRQRPAPTEIEPVKTDRVDLSPDARALGRLDAQAEIRTDLVARVRSEIAGGTYLTRDKIDAAIDAISSELEG